jgi:hypothetical protein
MKKIFTVIAVLAMFASLTAQLPSGFNYQAIIRDASGNIISNENITLKLSILDNMDTNVWTETHNVTTNQFGLVSLVVGQGAPAGGKAATFGDIDWSAGTMKLRTVVTYKSGDLDMGSSEIWAVPYSLVADRALSLDGDLNKLNIVEDINGANEEALFEVRNNTGQTVFAVYNEGVEIYFDDTDKKGIKGSFVVRGFGSGKADENNYMILSSDSARIYINNDETDKGIKGSFAVRGFGSGKADETDYMILSNDSARIYINNDESAKGIKGSFAVKGFGSTIKGDNASYFDINMDETSSIIDPAENRILWYPLSNAFLAGRILITDTTKVGKNSFIVGYESRAEGDYSQAMGYKAIARGDYSTAIGNQAIANDTNSFALGEMAFAQGVESYAFGREAKATGIRSFAFGSAAEAGSEGDYSWHEAGAPEASGNYSFAFGNGTKAQGHGSIAMGFKSLADGSYAVAMGYRDTASGYISTAMGLENTASGTYSTAMGFATTASGMISTAMGNRTTASGENSTAIGAYTTASGEHSTAMGLENTASGYISTAMGWCTTASGDYGSTAMGNWTTASGFASTAMGWFTTASGIGSTAMGRGIKVKGESSFGIGLDWTYDSITAPNTMAIMGGNVGIGTVSPDSGFVLHVNGAALANAWNTPSDQRLKTNIKPLQGALQSVLKLQGVSFNWIDETDHRPGQNIGFIAQEVKEIFPEIVSGGGKDEQGNEIYYSIEYATLTPVLVEAIKEQEKKIESQQQQIESQQQQIDELKVMVEKLTAK